MSSCSSNEDDFYKNPLPTNETKEIDRIIKGTRIYFEKEDSVNSSIAILKGALDRSYDANYIKGISSSSGKLGNAYIAISNLTGATGNFYVSLKNAELIEDTQAISEALFGLGLVMYNMNKWNDAIDYFTRSTKVLKRNNIEPHQQSLVNYLIGLCYYQQGYNRKANSHLTVSKGYALELGDSMRLQEIRLCFNNIELQNSTDSRILEEYNELLEVFAKRHEKVGISYTLEGKARYYLKTGDLQKATVAANQALNAVKKLNVIYPLQSILEVVTKAEYANGNYLDASNHLMELQTIKDSIQGINSAAKVVLMSADYEFEKKEKEFNNTISQQKRQRYILFGVVLSLLFVVILIFYLLRNVSKERHRSDKLLLNILPKETAAELKQYGKAKAKLHKDVTIVFADIKGFTNLAANLNSNAIVLMLDAYFSAFDDVIREFGLEKIKTIGDAYMFISGLYSNEDKSARLAVDASLKILEKIASMNETMKSNYGVCFEFRFGMHTGDVVSGVVGKDKYAFDVWGDAVNLAARMEETSEPGRLNITEATYNKLDGIYTCIPRGEISAKNKGKVKMFFVDRKS